MTRRDDGRGRSDELEAVLSEALERAAEALVESRWQPVSGDGWSASRPVRGRRGRRGRPIAIAVAVVLAGAAVAVAIVVRAEPGHGHSAGAPPAGGPGSRPAEPITTPTATRSANPHHSRSVAAGPVRTMRTVRVTTQESDGAVYGIGIPIVVQFDPAPRDARAFEDDTTVTVDGHAAGGAWYWVEPTAAQKRQHELEAHYRPRAFWPAHSHVHVEFGFGGRSAGAGLVFAKGLTSLDFSIGAAHVSVIDAQRLRMTVTTDGRFDRRLAVSLGAAVTPTYEGIKIVMQKGEDAPGTSALRPDGTVLMSGPGYTDHPVPWSVRITRSGEYVHAASWNHAIGERSTSNGCTNLSPADAKWFYGFSRIGDVVRYPRTDGGPMPTWDGVRDWNVPWSQWLAGGPGRPGA